MVNAWWSSCRIVIVASLFTLSIINIGWHSASSKVMNNAPKSIVRLDIYMEGGGGGRSNQTTVYVATDGESSVGLSRDGGATEENGTAAAAAADDTSPLPGDERQPPRVCFIGQSSGLYVAGKQNATQANRENYLKRLTILRDVSLYSWNLALLNSTSSAKPLVRCKVTGWEANFRNDSEFLEFMGRFENVDVDYRPDDQVTKRRLKGNPDGCDWVVVTRLDGDDAIRPGYWDHVRDLILAQRRFDPAGAGVVGTKLIPAVETTPDKCRANTEGNKLMVKSQGISTVYRWDVFEQMNYPFILGTHSQELGNLRLRYSGMVQGNKEDLERVANGGPMNEHDEMINSTGVHYVDTVLDGWGPPALWIRTSLSSHFPWIEWKKVPAGCDLEKWIEIIGNETDGRFSRDFLTHLYDHRNIGHLSLLEACQSNGYFLRFQFIRMRLENKTEAKTCDEFLDLYANYID